MSTIITNFLELLKKNYYSITEEKNEFLNWLQKNIHYNNGELQIHPTNLITESEIEDYNGNDTLKQLVKSWARSKHDKQEYWNELIDNNTLYINGSLYVDPENIKIINQDMTVSLTVIPKLKNTYRYGITVYMNSEFKEGQKIYVNDFDSTINATGRYSVQIQSKTEITNFNVRLKFAITDDKVYSGCYVEKNI